MKKLTLLLTLIFASTSQASTCLDYYQSKLDNSVLNKVAEKATGTGGGAVAIGMLAGSSAMMMVGFPVLAIGGGIMLTQEARYSRVINLLQDASDHVKTGGLISPGKHLRKFYKKLKYYDGELSITDIAGLLTTASENLSLCSDKHLKFYHGIKNSFKNPEIIL